MGLGLLMWILPTFSRAQAALLMEEPYGFFGTMNPTGHTAIYFARICAETPVKLRRCEPGELGSVIARYQGIAGYDWVAMPLIPYLYSVEDPSQVPQRVNRETVMRLRNRYHEQHLDDLGAHVFEGNLVRGGWTQLVGVAYERRIYAFRFDTTEAQDDALMAVLNDKTNHSHFDLIYSNCADFARGVMNQYFPRTFKRTLFPDAGMTTPRQITYKLVKYAKKHPDTDLTVFEIPQIPGYRRMSRPNKSVAASLITTGYAVPITLLNPYLAGAIFVDYLVRGRYPLIPQHPEMLGPEQMAELTQGEGPRQNPAVAGVQTGVASNAPRPVLGGTESPGLKAIMVSHE
ncbi:MAG TPA: hypothetical protein VMD29_04535 [Terracidiphilus sp.]|nr:hypothetical protein [Terracidiphilus sp.]